MLPPIVLSPQTPSWCMRVVTRVTALALAVLKSELDKAEADADAAREAHSEKDSKLQV